MSSPEPSDDFSQLPTADASEAQVEMKPQARVWQENRRRTQTRIGPAAAAPELEPASELSNEWLELLDPNQAIPETVYAPSPTHSPEQASLPVPTERPAPRRTVVGPRKPVETEDWTPPVETVPAEEPAASPETPEPLNEAAAEIPAEPVEAPLPVPAMPKRSRIKQATPETPVTEAPKVEEPEPKSDRKAPETNPAESPEKTENKDKPAAETLPAIPPGWKMRWEVWGGRSLAMSLGIHAFLILSGAWIVVSQVREKQVDFLSGGGSKQGAEASQDLQHKVQRKKNPWLTKPVPMRKIVTTGLSDIVLPEEMPDLLDLPQMSNMAGGGKLSGGMGLGGAGGGFGKGMGLGGRDGMVFQPLSMFGKEIKAKRLALILDASASMAPHLSRVIAEVDKQSRDSVVILYYGCGLESPPPKGLDGEEIFRTSSLEFEKYWRGYGLSYADARAFKFKPSDVIPDEANFRFLSKRPNTFFVHNLGTGYTWTALLSDQVRNSDALYWFADFQDRVDYKQLMVVRENLLRRKQRLYVHAYQRGSGFDQINTQLVESTGGAVIEEE